MCGAAGASRLRLLPQGWQSGEDWIFVVPVCYAHEGYVMAWFSDVVEPQYQDGAHSSLLPNVPVIDKED